MHRLYTGLCTAVDPNHFPEPVTAPWVTGTQGIRFDHFQRRTGRRAAGAETHITVNRAVGAALAGSVLFVLVTWPGWSKWLLAGLAAIRLCMVVTRPEAAISATGHDGFEVPR